MVKLADHLQIFLTCEVLVDGGGLAGQPDAGAQLVGLPHDVKPRHLGSAGVRPQQGGQDTHGRGLAGAVGAKHAQHSALLGGEIESAQGARLAIPLLQSFGQDRQLAACFAHSAHSLHLHVQTLA